jgi:hypothetical protein
MSMRGREDLTLDQAIRRAGSAGTLVRHEAVAVFLEVLRLATESQVVPDAAATLLGEDGSLTFAQAPSPQAAGAGDPIQAAGRLATGLFGAARIEPPLALGSGGEGSAERFPTLRHLRDAFELDLLLSGTPAPTDVERRMAIAALVAKSRQLPGTSAGPKERRPQAAREQLAPASDPSTRITEPPAPASDPSTRITEPPAPARWRPPRWLPLVAAGGLGILAGLLLDREPSRPPLARPAPAAPTPEIPLPPLDAPIGPAVADSRPGPRERAAPAAAPSQDPAPRPVRKLRRRAAAADAGAAARAKLQLGDESLKQGHFFEAVIAFREALNQDPPLPLAARRLGDAYRTHQDDDLALAAYERYLELDPSAQDADEVRDAVEQLRSGASPPR